MSDEETRQQFFPTMIPNPAFQEDPQGTVENSRFGTLYLVSFTRDGVYFETHVSRNAPKESACRYLHHCSREAWIAGKPFGGSRV